MLKHLTPVLVVDEIEPCLAFWTGGWGSSRFIGSPAPMAS